MEKRVRSPNYPAFGLGEAMQKIETLYKAQHTHGAPREVVARGLGYNGLNGASATSISALGKYGLLERHGEDHRVSERAMRILHPHSPAEKAEAIREAAFAPPLFQELADKFPGRLPAEEVLRNYLIRNAFAPSAVSSVILAYRETMELVEHGGGTYHTESEAHPSEAQPEMQPQPSATLHPSSIYQNSPLNQIDERSMGRHDFDDGAYVRIVAHGDIDTETALEWVEILIETKRRELKMRSRRLPVVVAPAAVSLTEDDDNA